MAVSNPRRRGLSHRDPQPLTPGAVTRFEIGLEPQAYRFRAGHCIRLEIINGDSPVTEALWRHYYRPDKIGADTITTTRSTSPSWCCP